MKLLFVFALCASLAVTIAGCTMARRDSEGPSLQTPIKLELGAPGAPAGPIRLRSGQMMGEVRCCPGLHLRDGRGTVIREFDEYTRGQRLAVPAGRYSLVGYDPAGKECVLLLEVTEK
jgi:hypothetical protein